MEDTTMTNSILDLSSGKVATTSHTYALSTSSVTLIEDVTGLADASRLSTSQMMTLLDIADYIYDHSYAVPTSRAVAALQVYLSDTLVDARYRDEIPETVRSRVS